MSNSIVKLKPGMKLFTPGSHDRKYFHLHSAVVSSPIYSPLSGAFKQSGDMIIEQHLASSGTRDDELLFPVLYLYRHSIELRLKDFLFLGLRMDFFDEKVVDEILDPKKGLIGQHRLCALWKRAKELLVHSYSEDTQVEIVESMIHELHRIDKDGQTLRYDRIKTTLRLRRPRFKSSNKSKSQNAYQIPDTFDIVNFQTSMNSLFEYLETRYDGILDWWDAQSTSG